ncbi:MAG: zinc metallopeptidase [Planctomycetaceae bacterium]|nr:zinc metallopeptidase [Planctomycetaceae bacterium]
MRWKDRQGSENVEDRRGRRRPQGGVAIGGGGVLLLVLLVWFMGGDPAAVLQQVQQQQPGGGIQVGVDGDERVPDPAQDELSKFVSVVLRDTEDVWSDLFEQNGRDYEKPKLVLFTGQVESACGVAGASVGPFYCPGDHNLYIDLDFYRELKEKFGAPGDFAQAYVIAHEVGHHVQNLLGVSRKVQNMQRQMSDVEGKQLSVRLELQADFYAGVWAHHAQQRWDFLEEGDVEEAIRCAQAIGDDRLQKMSRGYVVPEQFTHGSSAQRMKWFKKGLMSGKLSEGDTFSAKDL